jgi:mannose-6-phosphate isomerase-like protein (cupin superfamily)
MYWRNRRHPELNYDQPEVKPITEVDYMERPWGRWYVLDVDQGFKVKRLEILPDQAISLQYHQHRSEHWTIVQGEGKVIVDGRVFPIRAGESFHVPKYAIHKITNTHLNEILIAIEVQMGEICSEDDIVRC